MGVCADRDCQRALRGVLWRWAWRPACYSACRLQFPSAGQVLITEQEAKLPPLPGAVPVSQRGITRGPRVELVAPAKGVAPASPLRLHIKFTPYGGASIDPDSVKVTYVKSPAVDLTSRVKEFTRPTGIDLADAEVPQGEHLIRVESGTTTGERRRRSSH